MSPSLLVSGKPEGGRKNESILVRLMIYKCKLQGVKIYTKSLAGWGELVYNAYSNIER